MTTEHSDEESWDSLIQDKQKLHLADLTSRRASRSDAGKLTLGETKGRLDISTAVEGKSLQTIDATTCGEVQFRSPSRHAGGTSEVLKEPRGDEAMTRSRTRSMEQSQVFVAVEQDKRSTIHTTVPVYRGPAEGRRAPSSGVSEPEAPLPASLGITGSNIGLPTGVNSNHTIGSIMDRGHGLFMPDLDMMGKRINVREQEGSWRHRDQRGSSPSFQSHASLVDGEPMQIARGSRRINPGYDDARPSHTEVDRASQYETMGISADSAGCREICSSRITKVPEASDVRWYRQLVRLPCAF
jgi:hypothetical protein